MRKQLLKERDLTLHKAVQLCQIHESAERYSKEVPDQQEVLWTLSCTAQGTLPSIRQKVFFVHENASFRQSLQVNRNVSIVDHDEAAMLQEDADIYVITQRAEMKFAARLESTLTKSG